MQPQVTVPLYAAVLGLFCTALSQRPVTFSPFDLDGVFFSVACPTITASSGSGLIFFQIKAPSTLQWVGLGQGSQMARANMFILYSASSSNVTLSPRSGKGHFQPVPNLDSRVSLLDGSGIQDGMMTANVLCENCNDWQGGSMDPKSSSTQWFYTYREGSPINSDNVTEFIQKHNGHGATDSSYTTTSTDGTRVPDMPIAHGLMIAISFILLFPSLALVVLLPYAISIPKAHAPLQILTLALAISGMDVGLQLAVEKNLMMNSHPIIGIIVVVLLTLFQPAVGFFQHRHLRRDGGKSVFAYAHRWLDRSMIILGTINGGLGFHLAGIGNPGAPQSAMIAYSIIAGVVGLAYLGVHLLVGMQGRSHRQERKREPTTSRVDFYICTYQQHQESAGGPDYLTSHDDTAVFPPRPLTLESGGRKADLTMLYNALIRTHHITSRKKVAALKQAASAHNCFALLRSGGIPGIMYVESKEKEAVEAWVSVVRNLRYKDFQLVARPGLLEKDHQIGNANEKQWDGKKSNGRQEQGGRDSVAGLEEVETVKEFGSIMEDRGVWRWWRKGMGYVN
ncbi:cellobiose dehydrogenase [Aspergillus flavus AF70]|nr:cellobiose dehydrogenase [Aspergillus flavus AF70]